MFNIKEEYKNASCQYVSVIDNLEKLEEHRLSFNKNLIKELSKKYFGDVIEVITYNERDNLDCYGDLEYIFTVRILSKLFLQSKGKQRLDDNLVSKFKDDLRNNIIYNYKADHLQILIDNEYNGEDELKYLINIL